MENDTKKAAHLHSEQPSINDLSVTQAGEKINHKNRKKAVLIHMDEIQSTGVEWIWYPYIPRGKIVLLEADPGSGKTYLALWMSAVISCGGRFFRESENIHREPERVVYQTGEDGLSDTIKPRLEQTLPFPDMHRITIIKEDDDPLTLSDGRIEDVLEREHPALFVIDPFQNYLGAAVDMHRANEVRPILSHIARLADCYKCTFLFILHMNKSGQGAALYRALGSIDIPAIARSMLFLGDDPDNKARKILCHEKSSLAPKGESLAFTINTQKGNINWFGASPLSADDILRAAMFGRQKPSASLDDAVKQLNDLLGSEGAVKLEQVEALQEDTGFSRATMHRAKAELRLQTVGIGRPPHRETWWIGPDVNVEEFKASKRKVIELHPDDSTAET